MANLVIQSTKQMLSEFEFCRANLGRQHAAFQQKEGEKDRAKKMAKKRV